jgi:hypothetical protein
MQTSNPEPVIISHWTPDTWQYDNSKEELQGEENMKNEQWKSGRKVKVEGKGKGWEN